MRIAGGTLRGRILAAPPDGVLRPTQDAVREALFSMLAAVLPGASFLDLYAGTGAVGLEAWSRGAGSVAWVERAPRSLRVLETNLAKCFGEAGPPPALRVFRADVDAWLRRPPLPPGSVDIVFADPPYAEREGGDDGMSALLAAVRDSGLLAPVSFFVAEQRAGTPPPSCEGFELLRDRRYGRTRLALFRRDAAFFACAPVAKGG